MKTFKKLLCFATCTLGLIGSVNAATLAVGNDTTTAGAKNKSVTLELKDDDLKDYTAVEFQLTVSGTTYADIDLQFKTSGLGIDTSRAPLYKLSSDSGLFATTIGTVSYSTTENLSSNFKIVPTNVVFIKSDGTRVSAGNSGVKIEEGTIKYERAKSTDASLTSLTVSQGELSPAFSSTVYEYTVQVKDTINTIRLTGDSATGSTKTGTGSHTLSMGENNIEIVVTAEDGTTKNTYKVKVIRGEIEEPSAFLESLEINNIGVKLSPEFDSKNNKYTAKIGKDIEELNFKYTTEDPLAEVTIEGNENFKDGENLIKITVKSSDGKTEQIYEITVIREEEESTEEKPKDEDSEQKEEKKSNTWIIILIVLVILAVVAGVAILLFKKKKDGNNSKGGSQDNSNLPHKKREDIESTSEIELPQIDKEAKITVEDAEDDYIPAHKEESVTDILKTELYEDERTQRFNSNEFDKLRTKMYDEDDLGETKEFNFKDFE